MSIEHRPGALARLKERGFFAQCTDEERLAARLDEGPVTFYVGIDPTMDSMHIGHLVPIYALAHMAEFGHHGVAVVGGGTARIGDPSGKTEIRKILSIETIEANARAIGGQIERFLATRGATFSLVDNAEWLANLNYIEFLRDIGRHFSVNRMLAFETYKMRMETGLSFIEFNYQLMQSYDFLKLYQTRACALQIGGDDQWGNIVAGVDLIRRVEGPEAESFGLTFPLVTRSDGKKMGKSERGALFLDPERVSPYDFFQYWRNVSDADVEKVLRLFTFMPNDDVEALMGSVADNTITINDAKERVATEITSVVHGPEEAERARGAARALFSGGGSAEAMPGDDLPAADLDAGIGALDLFVRSGLCTSKGEARRLVGQGGARINDRKVTDVEATIDTGWVNRADDGSDELILRAGKKRYFRFVIR